MASSWVFGYGSLVGRVAASAGRRAGDWAPAVLRHHRRSWTAAMDNHHAVSGDKFYVTPEGTRPAVTVSFVGISPGDGRVNGVVFRVDGPALAALDRRERRYQRRRVEVASNIVAKGDRVYAYVTRADAIDRHRRSAAAGTDRIAAAYFERVRAAFNRLGPVHWDEFVATTVPPSSPVVELVMRRQPGRG